MANLLISFTAAILIPLVFLITLRGRMPRWLLVITLLYFPLLAIVAYPVGIFAYTLVQVTQALPRDCSRVISAVHRYNSWRILRPYDQPMLEASFELNPDIHTHSLLALCEYKLGNVTAAKSAIDYLSTIEEEKLARNLDLAKYRVLRQTILDNAHSRERH